MRLICVEWNRQENVPPCLKAIIKALLLVIGATQDFLQTTDSSPPVFFITRPLGPYPAWKPGVPDADSSPGINCCCRFCIRAICIRVFCIAQWSPPRLKKLITAQLTPKPRIKYVLPVRVLIQR